MGGAALGRQAKILTTAHLELLIRHCQTSLASLFPDTRPLLAFAEKETHGDLDLLVAYEVPFHPKAVKGEEFGLLDDEGKNLGPAPWYPVQGGRKDKGLGKEGAENEAFRQWAEGVVRALKGREWKRSGVKAGLMSIGVPCLRIEGLGPESLGFYVNFNDSGEWSGAEESKIKEGALKFQKEPFYQVDLQFISPNHMSFTHFFRSYSNILLSHLITLLSPHLRASGTHLSFHYSPYPGIGPIKIELTSDPDDFCEWLGLDYARFLQGFETRKDLWLWVTTVNEGGKAQRVWTGLVRRYKERTDNGIVIERVSLQWKSRNPGWTYFLEWLRLSDESPYSRVQPRAREVEQVDMGARIPVPETPRVKETAETGGLGPRDAALSSTTAMTATIASAMPLFETLAAEPRETSMLASSFAPAGIITVGHPPRVPLFNDEIPTAFRVPHDQNMSAPKTLDQAAPIPDGPTAEKRDSITLPSSLDGLSLVAVDAPSSVPMSDDEIPAQFRVSHPETISAPTPLDQAAPLPAAAVVEKRDSFPRPTSLDDLGIVAVDAPFSVPMTGDGIPEPYRVTDAGTESTPEPIDQASALPPSALLSLLSQSAPHIPKAILDGMLATASDGKATPHTTSAAPVPAKSRSGSEAQIPVLNGPADLCPAAREALERWHMVHVFEEMMEVKRVEAETMIVARLANAEEKAREKAELEAEAKEKALASGGALTDIIEGESLDEAARQSPPADTAATPAIVAKGLMVEDGCDDKAGEKKP